jgi:voltage-gated potassium channel
LIGSVSHHPLRRFALPGAALGLVLLYGTGGYLLIERWTLLDAFYMSVITITTVGYQEVHPLSPAGRLFTITVIAAGITSVLYALGVFIEVLSEGYLGVYRRERQMQRSIGALRDHFIVCGYGRTGSQIVREFERERVPYIAIDDNPEAVARLRNEGRLYIEADAASEEALKVAGIERARGLISAIDSDERAVYLTLAARALNPQLYILSRAGQSESARRLELAGAHRVVSPYEMAGRQLAELAIRPAVVDLMMTIHHGQADIAVEELLVSPACPAIGKTLVEADLVSGSTARLLALRRADGSLYINPEGDLVLQEDDLIIALGTPDELALTAALVQERHRATSKV